MVALDTRPVYGPRAALAVARVGCALLRTDAERCLRALQDIETTVGRVFLCTLAGQQLCVLA